MNNRGLRQVGHVSHIFKKFIFWRILGFDLLLGEQFFFIINQSPDLKNFFQNFFRVEEEINSKLKSERNFMSFAYLNFHFLGFRIFFLAHLVTFGIASLRIRNPNGGFTLSKVILSFIPEKFNLL